MAKVGKPELFFVGQSKTEARSTAHSEHAYILECESKPKSGNRSRLLLVFYGVLLTNFTCIPPPTVPEYVVQDQVHHYSKGGKFFF